MSENHESLLVEVHEVELGGEKFALRFEPLWWRMAEKELGIALAPPLMTPFWEPFKAILAALESAKRGDDGAAVVDESSLTALAVTEGQLLDLAAGLLYVGMRHALPKELRSADSFNEWLAQRVTWENLQSVQAQLMEALAVGFFLRLAAQAEKKAQPLTPTTPLQ